MYKYSIRKVLLTQTCFWFSVLGLVHFRHTQRFVFVCPHIALCVQIICGAEPRENNILAWFRTETEK